MTQNYTTDAIKFRKEDISNIVEQCKKWSGLDTPAKLVWLNEFLIKCLNMQAFPHKGEVVVNDISSSARQSNAGMIFGRDFEKRNLASVLYLFFHEFHHIKMYYLKGDSRQLEIYAKNPTLEVIASTMDTRLKIFEGVLQDSIYKISPHEFNADKFAKNCMLYFFSNIKDKNIRELFLNEIKRENTVQHKYLNSIKETIGLQHLSKEYVLPQIAELEAETESLKKIK